MSGSPSTNSLSQPKFSNLKIADQVIEEVDEQMTITSMRAPENRPTAASLFPPSQPVNVPAPRNDYMRTQSFAPRSDQPFTFPTGDETHPINYLSASAPTNSIVGTPTGDAYDLLVEDFDQSTPAISEQTLAGAGGDDRYIKKLQTGHHLDRPNRFLARSVSAQQQSNQTTGNGGDGSSRTEMLLDQMSRRNDGLSSSVDNNNSQRSDSSSTPL